VRSWAVSQTGGAPGDWQNAAVGLVIVPRKQRQPDDALVADGADLDGDAFLGDRDVDSTQLVGK
jgi:hypothetical protein